MAKRKTVSRLRLYVTVMLKGEGSIMILMLRLFLKFILIGWYILFFLKFLNWSCVYSL